VGTEFIVEIHVWFLFVLFRQSVNGVFETLEKAREHSVVELSLIQGAIDVASIHNLELLVKCVLVHSRSVTSTKSCSERTDIGTETMLSIGSVICHSF